MEVLEMFWTLQVTASNYLVETFEGDSNGVNVVSACMRQRQGDAP